MPPLLLETEWRTLAVANYAFDPAVLAPYVPRGTTLDTLDGVAYASVVGFEWVRPRLWGIPAPFHGRFAELNLRTYVREGDRLGVVFLKELVGMPLVAWIGRYVFQENFALGRVAVEIGASRVTYRWRQGGLQFDAEDRALTDADFFLERDWAYTAARRGPTMAYPVARSSGVVRAARALPAGTDWDGLYGATLAAGLHAPPVSAFLAEGAPVSVGPGRALVGTAPGFREPT
ncbi:MAG: hypothetical protein JWM80_3486 [Cyanobacteria bacterium RYN_339]|nr:hypothetical protein [Cyanobacteria bacterium RYN_339]